jgi:hypothetical protein
MAEAPEIKVKLTAEDTGVSAAIKELTSQLKTLKKQQDETASSGFSLAKAFQGIVAAGALLKFEEIGKEAFDSAVNIGKMADKTGLTTQALSVFHKVAGDVGVSTEAVDKGLTKAAKSITEFEQGSVKAAKAFQLLGIRQKDFAGLKPDEKIALVTDRIGKMQAGFAKATAAQLIFSKGGSEMIPVLNSLAAQGFDKATEATSKLGLLLDQETTDAFRSAKASLQELTDVGKGMATQFEAGLLPAISDVGEALVDSLTQGGISFKDLGKYAGDAVRGISLIFLGLGQTLGTVAESIYDAFSQVWKEIKTEATTNFTAIGQAIHGNFTEALKTLEAGQKRSAENVRETIDRQKAIYGALADSFKADYNNLFPSAEEEERRRKQRIARLRPDKETPERPIENDVAVGAELKRQNQLDAIAKAQAAALQRQLQDELTIWQSYEKQREQVEKNSYDQGRLSTEAYYARRQADLKTETEKELEILKAQLTAAQEEADRTAAERDSFAAKAKKAGPDSRSGQLYDAAAARNDQEHIAALAKVDEVQTKIAKTTIDGQTKSMALGDAQVTATRADHQNTLEFQREIDALQGKTRDAAREEIEIEVQKRTIELQRAGVAQQEIDAEIAKYRELKTAAADFAALETQTQQDMNAFDIERRGIEIEQKAGLLTKAQAEKRINDLIGQRLPLLRQEAAAELAAAQKSGNQADIAKAQNLILELDNLQTKTHVLATQVKGALSSDFQTFFSNLTSGTKSVGRAFAELGISVVQSLERIAAQMLINFAIEKLSEALGIGGASGKIAQTVTTNDAIITSDAGVAGAAAFASVMEDVPFPANIATAPGVMAAAIAATLSNLALGSAAQGALLPEDMLIQAHAQEMILPKELSIGLRNVIATNRFHPPQALSQPLQSRGGDQYFHDEYHLHHNGPDALQVLDRELVPRIKLARRRGELP